jgi:tetratricopeptide (TPR) repeat protein
MNPADYKAPYYLGNFWYAHRRYEEAISCWEKSVEINNQFPTALRNLSLAYYNKRNKKEEARQLLEKAFELDKTDSRIFMELDQLYKKMGRAHAERLALLEEHLDLVEQRDDLCIERITLYNLLGDYEKAKDLISNRKFHPWEGGEGKVTGQYILCRVELAKKAIKENRYSEAVALLKETEFYPHNLGEGKLSNAEENEVDYYKGIAYQKLGNDAESTKYLMKATQGSTEPQQAFYYNDQQPDKIFYQGLAWRALGEENKARSRFNKLIDHGKKHLFDDCKIDYFAVSLPELAIWEDNLNIRNQIHCYYVMALGYSGLGKEELAEEYYEKVKRLDVNKQVFRM